MILPQLTILEFAHLPQSMREDLETQAKYIVCDIEINCKEWAFIDVKEAIELIKQERTYQLIIDVCSKNNKLIKTDYQRIYWFELMVIFYEIEHQLIEIIELENNSLGGYEPTAKEIKSGIEAFNIFGFYNQIKSLSKSLSLSLSDVERLTWNKAFIELNYTRVESSFIKEMNKI